jgi:hypothetical protein
MASSGLLRRVALVRTDVSKENISSVMKVTRIGELGTLLAVISNRGRLRSNTKWAKWAQFLQEQQNSAYQKTEFFIVTTVRTSNLTLLLNGFTNIPVTRKWIGDCYPMAAIEGMLEAVFSMQFEPNPYNGMQITVTLKGL